MTTFSGIITALITPFADDRSIDLGALGGTIDFIARGGGHGLVVGGSTGEYYAQSVDERLAVLREAKRVAPGEMQMLAGINSARPDETMQLGRAALEIGYDAVLLAAPYYSLPSSKELAAHVRAVASEVNLPVVLYNFPARTGVDMDIPFLASIADVSNVRAIKESSGDFGRLLAQVQDFPDRFERICGADDQALDYFLWGSTAWIAGLGNALPAAHVALYETCIIRRDFIAGRSLMQRLLPIFTMMERSGKYTQCVKYACELAGVASSRVRAPLAALDGDDRTRFARLFAQARDASEAAFSAID